MIFEEAAEILRGFFNTPAGSISSSRSFEPRSSRQNM